ncbi:hypothetical protein [Pseudoroseicyclus sp. CXY001]|uniref:hypothetical protein n=1 Tax=Pseudoroseicyclus sp. CXY001 TaxID=3242492 RepID=UPI00357170A5
MQRPLALALILALLTGCDSFPKDPDGTTERIAESGVMRAGIVGDAAGEAEERALATALAAASGAEAELHPGSAETLLLAMEAGELDIVIGDFAEASPWAGRLALAPSPLTAHPPKEAPVLRALLPPGENRWLLHVTKTIEDMRP